MTVVMERREVVRCIYDVLLLRRWSRWWSKWLRSLHISDNLRVGGVAVVRRLFGDGGEF